MPEDRNTVNAEGGNIDNRGGSIVQARDIINVWGGASPHERRGAFVPLPEEAVILTRLLDSRDQKLLFWQSDDGICLVIDGQALVDPKETEVSQSFIEGFQRLEAFMMLVNNSGDRRVYEMTTTGRGWARQLRGKCPWCGELMDNAQKDPKQPVIWECHKPRCLHSTWHRNKKCEVCGKPPAQLKDVQVGYAEYRCADGHTWTK